MYKALDDRARMGSLAELCPKATKDKPCIHRCHKLVESIMKEREEKFKRRITKLMRDCMYKYSTNIDESKKHTESEEGERCKKH